MKSMAMAIALTALASLPARGANFLVEPKIVCTRTGVATTGKEQLTKSALLKTQILQMCLDTHPELSLNDVEFTYDSDSGVLHVVRKCDGAEVCDFGSAFCVQAFNGTSSGTTDKVAGNSLCVLELFFSSDTTEIFGTALGKEKVKSESTNGTETKLSFKGTYQGQIEFFTLDDQFVCTIKFSTGARFTPAGVQCPQ